MAHVVPSGLSELQAACRSGGGLLWSVGLFSVFANLLMLTGPLFMLQVYDRVLGSRSVPTLMALFLLVAVLYGLMAMLDYARGRLLARFGARFQDALNARVFHAVMRRALAPEMRSKPASGLRDVDAVQGLFISPVMLALFDLPWTPLFFGFIFVFHPLLGWMAVAGGAVLVAATLLNSWLIRNTSQEAQDASARAHGFAEHVRHQSELVWTQGMTTSLGNRWEQMRGDALDQTLGASDWTGLFSSFTKAFRLFLQSAMLAVGAWLTLRGEMTPGAIIAGSILLGRALAPIEQSIGQWPMVLKARAGWNALNELLEAVPQAKDVVSLPKPEGQLDLKGVYVTAPGTRHYLLSNVNFSLQPGEVLGVIGKSGSGKSTLARTVLGLHGPTAGEVRIGGARLDQYDRDALGSYVGYLPQQVSLFAATIAENIARMSLHPDDDKVIAAAKRANAHDLILALPNGYQTVVHADGGELSGGQRQRIALARALYGDPVLLLLDEPNSALDGEGTEALNRTIREFKTSGRTVVIMTHRPTAISECDRLMVIESGRIQADGPRDEVLKSMVKNASNIQRTFSARKEA